MKFPPVMNGPVISDLAWSCMVPHTSSCLGTSQGAGAALGKGCRAGQDHRPGRVFSLPGPLIYPMFPCWMAPNIRSRGQLREGNPKMEIISLGYRSPDIGQVPQEVQTLLPSAVVRTREVVWVLLLPDE